MTDTAAPPERSTREEPSPPATAAPSPQRPPWWRRWVDLRSVGLFLGLLAVLLVVWELLARSGVLSPLAPSVGDVAVRAVEVLANPFSVDGNEVGIGWDLVGSLQRVMIGFGAAALVGVPMGFLIGVSPMVSAAVDPFVQVLRPVSPLAWLPLGLALLQDSQSTALFVIFITSLWPIVLNTSQGVCAVPRSYLDLARTVEASRWTTARRVLFPAALPSIVTGLRLSLGIAWVVIVAAEMLMGGEGIGFFVWNEWNNLNIASIVVAIVVIGVVGLGLDRALGLLERTVRHDD